MGMPKIEMRLQMFRGDWDQIWSQQRLLWLMEGLCRVNQTHLREMNAFKERGLLQKAYPLLYRSGVHYETEKGTEIWPDIPSLLEGVMGKGVYPGPWGDCEDLACYRVAELRELPFHYERGDKKKPEVADPNFPQNDKELAAAKAGKDWPGWKKVKGGIRAKPYAKFRRGPEGNYHYHALVLLPDGRIEDPSLVLGMGNEREFDAQDMKTKLKDGDAMVVIQFAKKPDVMVVDPEKPSGFAGGKAGELDRKVLETLQKQGVSGTAGDPSMGAFLANEISADGGLDVDSLIGWNRSEKRFVPRTEETETRRLMGYSKH